MLIKNGLMIIVNVTIRANILALYNPSHAIKECKKLDKAPDHAKPYKDARQRVKKIMCGFASRLTV
jgi:hypothetical protein